MSPAMVTARGISKRFGRRTEAYALRDLSFEVEQKAILGLLGVGGSGKNTLLRILATLVRPTEGRAEVGGFDVVWQRDAVKRILGYLPQTTPAMGDMSVGDYLSFSGMVEGLSKRETRVKVEELEDALEFEAPSSTPLLEAPAYAQRMVRLTQALMTDPGVLLLNEPMAGLDASQRTSFAKNLEMLRGQGMTILLSSSRLEEMRMACTHVLTMAEGRAVGHHRVDDLLGAIAKGHHARIFLENSSPENAQALKGLPGIIDVRESSSTLILYVDPRRVAAADVRRALGKRGEEVQIQPAEITLGDVLRAISEKRET